MNDITIADVSGIGRKLRTADFTIEPKAQIETNGIGRSTNETAIRFTLQTHTPVLIIRGDTSRYDISVVYPMSFIEQRLAEHEPETFQPRQDTRQAAVAIILREGVNGPDMLFIKRAERTGDPWSGHMAFPGGHLDAEDADLKTAAMRETWEEVGLDLAPAVYLGPLDQQRAMPRGRPLNMLIAPHVFKLERAVEFNINHEVAEVVWTEMGAMVTGANHDWETKPMAGRPTVFNGYRLEAGHFVWGLTYRMVKSFFAMLDPAWRPPPER
ncbi:MAG: CoA pyrophosphatase [Chloroflexi bacterium]|nr:MAG: CoA pyrophosphatase [Chloroflexota bacterium]